MLCTVCPLSFASWIKWKEYRVTENSTRVCTHISLGLAISCLIILFFCSSNEKQWSKCISWRMTWAQFFLRINFEAIHHRLQMFFNGRPKWPSCSPRQASSKIWLLSTAQPWHGLGEVPWHLSAWSSSHPAVAQYGVDKASHHQSPLNTNEAPTLQAGSSGSRGQI